MCLDSLGQHTLRINRNPKVGNDTIEEALP